MLRTMLRTGHAYSILLHGFASQASAATFAFAIWPTSISLIAKSFGLGNQRTATAQERSKWTATPKVDDRALGPNEPPTRTPPQWLRQLRGDADEGRSAPRQMVCGPRHTAYPKITQPPPHLPSMQLELVMNQHTHNSSLFRRWKVLFSRTRKSHEAMKVAAIIGNVTY